LAIVTAGKNHVGTREVVFTDFDPQTLDHISRLPEPGRVH
jgi:hypothetical protein